MSQLPMPATRPRSLMHRITVRLGPVGRPLAGTRWIPLYAILRHTGRTSGKQYAIPVVAFPAEAGFVMPLPFGDETQWLRNLVAGPGRIRWRAREYAIDRPEVVDIDDAAVGAAVPGILRAAARRLGITRWVRVRRLA